MGWAAGSRLLEDIADLVMPKLPERDDRRHVARELIEMFQKEDCDTICEVEQEDIRAVYDEMYPPEGYDEDEEVNDQSHEVDDQQRH